MKEGPRIGGREGRDGRTVWGIGLFLIVPHLAWVGLADYGSLKDHAVLLFGLIWLGLFLDRRSLAWMMARMWPWGWIALAALTVPLAWAPDAVAGLGQLASWVLLAAVGIPSGRYFGSSPARVKALLVALSASAAITCLIGLSQLFGGLDWPEQTRAPAATFSNRNVAAHWLVAAWPATFVLFGFSRSAPGRLLALVPFVLVPLYLVLSGSKAGLGALFVEALVMLWLSGRIAEAFRSALPSRKSFVLGGSLLILMVLGLTLWEVGADRMEEVGGERFWRSSLEESLATRLDASASAVRMALDRPFGVGAGQFERVYPLYESTGSGWSPNLTRRQGSLHNDALQVLVEGGVLWVPILAMGVFTFGRSLWRAGWYRDLRKSANSASPFAYAGLAGLGLLGLVSFPFQAALTLFAAFLMAGLLSGHDAGLTPREAALPPRGSGGGALRWWRWAVTLALLGFGGWISVRQVVADALFYRQAGAFMRGDGRGVEQLGESLLEWWPRHEMGADLLGRIRLQEGQFAVAETHFDPLRKRWPNDPAYAYHHSLALAGLGRHAEALEVLEPLVRRYSEDPSLHFILGAQHFGVGDFNRAYVAFHEAARLDPDNWLYAHNTGVAAERAGWSALAIEAYAYALRLEPDRELSRKRLEALQPPE